MTHQQTKKRGAVPNANPLRDEMLRMGATGPSGNRFCQGPEEDRQRKDQSDEYLQRPRTAIQWEQRNWEQKVKSIH